MKENTTIKNDGVISDPINHVFNELVFIEPSNLPFTRENIKSISEKIQKEFIKVFNDKYNSYFSNMFPKFFTHTDKDFSLDNIDKSPSIYLFGAINYLGLSKFEKDTKPYDEIGFTPKLSKMSANHIGGLNCFGYLVLIGSMCKVRGIPVEICIRPDHPLLLVTLEGQKYIVDPLAGTTPLDKVKGKLKKVEGKLEKMKGKLNIRNGKKIFFQDYSKACKKWSQMMYIHDFDEGIIYEILENLEVYRQVALGKENIFLPNMERECRKLIESHKDFFLMNNWRMVQENIFPDIHETFLHFEKEWRREQKIIRRWRNSDFTNELLYQVLEKGLIEVGLHDKKRHMMNPVWDEVFNHDIQLYSKYMLQFIENPLKYFDRIEYLHPLVQFMLCRITEESFGLTEEYQCRLRANLAFRILDKKDKIEQNQINFKQFKKPKENVQIRKKEKEGKPERYTHCRK
jgi:hypothetical protein